MSITYNKVKLFKYGDKGYNLLHFQHDVLRSKNGVSKKYNYFCCNCREFVVPDSLKLVNIPVNISDAAKMQIIPTEKLQCPLCKTIFVEDATNQAQNTCHEMLNPDALPIVEYAGMEYVVEDGEIIRVEYIHIEREYMMIDGKFRTRSRVHTLIADKKQRQLYYTSDTPTGNRKRIRNFHNLCPVSWIAVPSIPNMTQQFCNAVMYNFFGITAPNVNTYCHASASPRNINFMAYFAVRYPLMLSIIDNYSKNVLSVVKNPSAYSNRLLQLMWQFANDNKDINKLFLCTDIDEYNAIIEKFVVHYDHQKSVEIHAKTDPLFAAFMIQMYYFGFRKEQSLNAVAMELSNYLVSGKSKIHFGFLISQRTHALKRLHKSFIKVFGELDWINDFDRLTKHAAMYNLTDSYAVKIYTTISMTKYPQKKDFIEMLRSSSSVKEALDNIN